MGIFWQNSFVRKGMGKIVGRCVQKCSKKLVYLCGSDKFDAEERFVSLALDDADYFVSNENVSEEIG